MEKFQNLEQLRAKHALDDAKQGLANKGKNGGEVAKKVPAMIQQNGLLGALAFALNKNEGHKNVLEGAIDHYRKTADLARELPSKDALVFATWLSGKDSATLRAATAEILAYLNYYRRFADMGKVENKNENRD